jgi:hypothetical protein
MYAPVSGTFMLQANSSNGFGGLIFGGNSGNVPHDSWLKLKVEAATNNPSFSIRTGADANYASLVASNLISSARVISTNGVDSFGANTNLGSSYFGSAQQSFFDTSGNLKALTDGGFDIGASASARPANIYASAQIRTPGGYFNTAGVLSSGYVATMNGASGGFIFSNNQGLNFFGLTGGMSALGDANGIIIPRGMLFGNPSTSWQQTNFPFLGVDSTTNMPAFSMLAGTNYGAGRVYASLTASNLVATNMVIGTYGCLAMGTGAVSVATSTSTNAVGQIFNYADSGGNCGVETNSNLVVTNAGKYRISFGAGIAAQNNASAISLHLMTNGTPAEIVWLEATPTGTTTYETGFKEFTLSLPALCRVTLAAGNAAANAVNIRNVCLNVKGPN